MGPIGALAITRHMVAKLPYDIERDFQPIAMVARGICCCGVAAIAGQFGAGADRLRQKESRQTFRMHRRASARPPCRRRAVQIHDRHGRSCTFPIAAGSLAINDLIAAMST